MHINGAVTMSAKRTDPEDGCAPQHWQADYDTLMNQFKSNGEFKKFVIATDSEFGPEWAARNHSRKFDLIKPIIKPEKEDTGIQYEEKVLYDGKGRLNVGHLRLKDPSNAELRRRDQ